jgi:hypothetical protein
MSGLDADGSPRGEIGDLIGGALGYFEMSPMEQAAYSGLRAAQQIAHEGAPSTATSARSSRSCTRSYPRRLRPTERG